MSLRRCVSEEVSLRRCITEEVPHLAQSQLGSDLLHGGGPGILQQLQAVLGRVLEPRREEDVAQVGEAQVGEAQVGEAQVGEGTSQCREVRYSVESCVTVCYRKKGEILR